MKRAPFAFVDDPVASNIDAYLHCTRCLAERPPAVSPRAWSRTQAGWTRVGLQVWCNRHGCNVVHIDFEDAKHPAETRARCNSKPDADWIEEERVASAAPALLDALLAHRRGTAAGGVACWCAVAIDDPRMRDHSEACKLTRAALVKVGVEVRP